VKITFDDFCLQLIPENDSDRRTVKKLFGNVQFEKDRTGRREFTKTDGKAIYQLKDSEVIEIDIRPAWWNYDD
jgi:hypothetical protein